MKLSGFYALDSGEQSVCTRVVEIMTLLSSDVLTTGMASGISSLAEADDGKVPIEGTDRMQNPVLEGDAR